LNSPTGENCAKHKKKIRLYTIKDHLLKEVVSFGCSFTHGHDMHDPEHCSWPALIAQKLNAVNVNKAVSGHSLDCVIKTFFATELNPEALVLIGLPPFHRVRFADKFGDFVYFRRITRDAKFAAIGLSNNHRQPVFDFVDKFGSDKDTAERHVEKVIMLQAFLKNRGTKHLFVQHFAIHDLHLSDIPISLIPSIKYLDLKHVCPFLTRQLIPPTELTASQHPNTEGHIKIATEVMKTYDQLYRNI
jgi:hypothetical protein